MLCSSFFLEKQGHDETYLLDSIDVWQVSALNLRAVENLGATKKAASGEVDL